VVKIIYGIYKIVHKTPQKDSKGIGGSTFPKINKRKTIFKR